MAKLKSVFGTYAEQLQAVVDVKNDRFAPTWFGQYFDFDIPQTSLTFQSVIGRSRIEAAASVIARGSAAPLRSRQGLEKLSGEIPAIAEKFVMREEDYRNFMMLQAMPVSDQTKKQQLLDLLFADVKKTGDSLMKRLDIMALEAISTGAISLDIDNNPDGMVLANPVDLLMPSGNRTNAAVNWNTSATATPITDIENAVAYQKSRGVVLEKALMSDAAWQKFRKATEVKEYLGAFLGKANNKLIPTLDLVNEFLRANRLPFIEIVDAYVGIEKDGVVGNIRPFSDTNVSFVPAGKLGVIKNAIAIEEMRPVTGVSYAKFNNGLISKWSENEPFAEYTKGELNAFPAVDAIDQIHLLSTTVAF
jgi:hypothetical protein